MLSKQSSMRGSRLSTDVVASPSAVPDTTTTSASKRSPRRSSSSNNNTSGATGMVAFPRPVSGGMPENTCQNACIVSFDSVLGLLGIASPTKAADDDELFKEREDNNVPPGSTAHLSKSDIDFKAQFESVLEKNGFLATLYLPSVDNSRPKKQVAVVRKKRSQDRIDCEVIVDNKPKLFRFSLLDVSIIGKGKGKSKVVPSEVDEAMCMYFNIKEKGELSFVLKSESLRNDILRGFNILSKV